MDDRDTIRRRIIDRAVGLFNDKEPNRGGLFTTAHYGQAVKAEFGTPGPTLDSDISAGHLSQMGDIVEKAGGNLWRRKSRPGGPLQDAAPSDCREGAAAQVEEICDRLPGEGELAGDEREAIEFDVEQGVMGVLSDPNGDNVAFGLPATTWWTVGLMAATLHRIEKKHDLKDGLLEDMVGLVLYSLAVEGKVLSQPNMMVDGARATIFTLAPKSVDVDDMQPPFGGPPADGNFGNS